MHVQSSRTTLDVTVETRRSGVRTFRQAVVIHAPACGRGKPRQPMGKDWGPAYLWTVCTYNHEGHMGRYQKIPANTASEARGLFKRHFGLDRLPPGDNTEVRRIKQLRKLKGDAR